MIREYIIKISDEIMEEEIADSQKELVRCIEYEKVIKGLDICTQKPCYCTDCPYKPDCYLDSQEVMEDALFLLRKQHEIIEQYHKVDGFLDAHGWKWN